MTEISISFWLVLASVVLYSGLGFAWYSSILFGDEWRRLSLINTENLNKSAMIELLAWTALSSFVMSYVLLLVLGAFVPQSLYECLSIALFTWLGLSASTSIGDYLYLRRPLKLFLINSGYNLAGFIMIAILFRIWG